MIIIFIWSDTVISPLVIMHVVFSGDGNSNRKTFSIYSTWWSSSFFGKCFWPTMSVTNLSCGFMISYFILKKYWNLCCRFCPLTYPQVLRPPPNKIIWPCLNKQLIKRLSCNCLFISYFVNKRLKKVKFFSYKL